MGEGEHGLPGGEDPWAPPPTDAVVDVPAPGGPAPHQRGPQVPSAEAAPPGVAAAPSAPPPSGAAAPPRSGQRPAATRPRMATLPIGSGVYAVFLVLFVGAWATTFSLAVLLAVKDRDHGTATVLGVVPGGDQVRVRTGDGPDAPRFRVSFLDPEEVEVGDEVAVDLVGRCRCEPVEPAGDWWPYAALSVLPGLGALALIRQRRRFRPYVRAYRTARAVLRAGGPGTAVALEMSARKEPEGVAGHLDLARRADGRLLGHVRLNTITDVFDPHLDWEVVGQPEPGNPVALRTAAGDVVLLPISPLEPGVAARAPWSDEAVRRCGFGPPPKLAPLPGSGRVSAAEIALPDPGADDEIAAVEERKAEQVGAMVLMLVAAAGFLGSVLGLVTTGPAYAVIALAGFASFAWQRSLKRRAEAPLREATDDPAQLHAASVAAAAAIVRTAKIKAPPFAG